MKQLCVLALCALVLVSQAGEPRSLQLVKAIPLPEVSGRFDHFSVDVKGRRLFVAALGNNTVEVLDLNAGKRLRSIKGCDKPQGVLYLEKANTLFIANGGNGKLRAYAKLDRVYVGYGDGALGVVNPTSGVLSVSVNLLGHPESFQLEREGNRVFVNVPEAQQIAVVDLQTKSVTEAWLLPGAKANFPMALDEGNRRLFVGCRSPAKLVVLDTASGKTVSELVIAGDTDDLFYDAKRKRIYVSAGEGFVDIIEQRDADQQT